MPHKPVIALVFWAVVAGGTARCGGSPPAAGESHPAISITTTTSVRSDTGTPAASAAPLSAQPSTSAGPSSPHSTEPWRALNQFDFAALSLDQVPQDDGNVSPMAGPDDSPAPDTTASLDRIEKQLPKWGPGHVADPVQRVRNYLLLLGVADIAQSPTERYLPAIVLAHMLKEFPPQEVPQLLCWVAQHSDDGDVSALKDPLLVELGAANQDPDELRTRTYYYGVKLTHRTIGW